VKLAIGVIFVPRGVVLIAPPFFYVHSRECSSLGVNEGVNIPPRGKYPLSAPSFSTELGVVALEGVKVFPQDLKFIPRGELMIKIKAADLWAQTMTLPPSPWLLTSTPSHWPSWSQFYKTVSAKIYGLNLI
jgi:hypothetical protein